MNRILAVEVGTISTDEAVQRIMNWAAAAASRYVCVANVHSIMEAHDSAAFREILKAADLVVPDGMPLVWMLRLMGHPEQQRVYGPALMEATLRAAAASGVPIGLYGSTPQVLQALEARLARLYPELKIVYSESPPFDGLNVEPAFAARLANSGPRILFVGLGCPKQERWMAANRGRIPCVMIGVGAAFDFLAGAKPRAPRWMQSAGLEWLFRLATEPRRLWKRYLYHNPRFVLLAAAQLLRSRNS